MTIGKRRQREGGAAVEFAIVASAFLMFLFFILEVGVQLAVGAALDYGTRDAARYGATGRSTNPSRPEQRLDDITARVIARTSPLLDFGRLTLTPESFAGSATDAASGFAPIGIGQPGNLGNPGDAFAIVRYDVVYEQPLITPVARLLLGRDSIQHRTVLIVKNEPFIGAAP